MTAPQRIKVKLFVSDPSTVDLSAIVPIFHGWIQQHAVEGALIDIADYKHVQSGPGIILVGFDADYAIDMARGRPGLQYDHKRAWPTTQTAGQSEVQARVLFALRRALLACKALEETPAAGGRLTFDYGELEIAFSDRLAAPNQPEVSAALAEAVQSALTHVYGGSVALTALSGDPRRPVAFQARAAGAPDRAALLDRLQAAALVNAA